MTCYMVAKGPPVRRRDVLKSAAGATAAVSLGGCLGDDDPDTLTYGLIQWSPYAPLELGVEQGFYEEEGVDIEFEFFEGHTQIVQAMAAGEVDVMSFNPSSIAIARSKGAEITIIGAHEPAPRGWTLDVMADSDIEEVTDLEGRQIGIADPGAATHFYTEAIADLHGIDVEVLSLGAAGIPAGLEEGDVDAGQNVVPFNAMGYDDGWLREIAEVSEELGDVLNGVYAASDQVIADGANLEGVLRGATRGVEYMVNNEEEAVDFLVNYNELPESVNQLVYEMSIQHLSTDAAMTAEDIDGALDVVQYGGVDRGDLPPTEEFFTDEFIPS